MKLQAAAERVINRTLAYVGLRLQRVANDLAHAPTLDGALFRIARRTTTLATIVDIGASDGRWSAQAMQRFPHAQYLLVEAQSVHQRALQRFVIRHRNARFVLAAAGDMVGSVRFEATDDPFGGRASKEPLAVPGIEVPMTTIDALVSEYQLPPPFCLKLDVHGFELPIFQGAISTLRQTALIVVECYAFRFADNLLIHEMIAHMEGLGFRCIDLIDPLYRPRDGAFWQADLFFVPSDQQVFTFKQYQ